MNSSPRCRPQMSETMHYSKDLNVKDYKDARKMGGVMNLKTFPDKSTYFTWGNLLMAQLARK